MNSDIAKDVQRSFERQIGDPSFPCAGAKSALGQGKLHFLFAADLRLADHDVAIAANLQSFAAGSAGDAVFLSQVVLFPDTPALDELQFEQALWLRLQSLHEVDAARYGWDASVSDDPDSAQFSLSIGGRGFYVVGVHPGASRAARRFQCAALVFNLHSQFETLRTDGRYDKLRSVIIERDIAYSGSRNPMLAVHGASSEARQYSGRTVAAGWQCPFCAQPARRSNAP